MFHLTSRCATCAAELEGAGIYKMKMLQKMRLLEEKGQTFASTPIKDLKVFGEDGAMLAAYVSLTFLPTHSSHDVSTLHQAAMFSMCSNAASTSQGTQVTTRVQCQA